MRQGKRAQPRAKSAYRVPRSSRDLLFEKGRPSDPIRRESGVVIEVFSDTVTCRIQGEEVPKIAVQGDMPEVGDRVDIYVVGDFLFIPATGGLSIVHHHNNEDKPRPDAAWVLWLGLAKPKNARPYDMWQQENL